MIKLRLRVSFGRKRYYPLEPDPWMMTTLKLLNQKCFTHEQVEVLRKGGIPTYIEGSIEQISV